MTTHLSQGSPQPDPEYVSPPAGRQEWSAAECMRMLYRRRSDVAWITCAGALAAALVSAVQPRMYQSQASLEIQGFNENFLNFRDIYPTAPGADSSGTYVQTQADILQEDALIEQVVAKLQLEQRPEYQDGPSLWDKFRRIAGRDPSPAPAMRNAVEGVKKNLKIVPARGSRIVRIVFDARDPQLAADLANTLAATFIEQSIEARQRAARQTHESLSLQLDDLRKKLLLSESQLGAYSREASVLDSQRPSSAAYRTFKREVDAKRQFYETMSQRVSDAGVASSVRQSNVRLIGSAQAAAHPYKPNLRLNLAIGMFGGLVLAIGGLMLKEQTGSLVSAPGEAGAYLTLPELGAIPQARPRGLTARSLLPFSCGAPFLEPAAAEQTFSTLSESFRATVASILSANSSGGNPRIFVVTSSQPMEGKTTVVSNLGIALAEIGGKVLLIDGDMRRPRLHKVFDQANSWGLSDILREKNAIEDLPLEALVKKTSVPHLYMLPSGACADNIFGLLLSGRLERLLPRFRQEFDYVLVDAPPCLEFADARIMARYADQVLLVVRANYTDRRTAQAAVQRLLLDGIPVMGVVLNRWDPARSDIYSYSLHDSRTGLA